MKNVRTSYLICLLFACVLFLTPVLPTQAYESAQAKVKDLNTIKVSWSKKKRVKKWVLKQETLDQDGNRSKKKKVATLKGSKRSFTLKKLKKNTWYFFELIAYEKKKGKLVASNYDYLECFTGVSPCAWSEYAHADPHCSPDRIDLDAIRDDSGLKPDGYILYRKMSGESKFKKLAVIKKNTGFYYKDKNVKKGAEYQYKFRAYKKYKGKKIYSPYSEVLLRSAVNQVGSFASEQINRTSTNLILKIKSKEYNGELVLEEKSLALYNEGQDPYDGSPVILKAYSPDGNTWTELKNSLTIKGGETFYLKFAPLKGSDFTKGNKLYGSLTYNRLPSILDLSVEGTGMASMDTEAIH